MMDYVIVKYLHVLVSIAWLGGAFAVILLGAIAARRKDTANLLSIARNTETLAKLIFMPSSLVILVLGIIMVLQRWSFGDAWIVIGILGVVTTGAIGGLLLTPMVKKLAEAGSDAEAADRVESLLTYARADLIMLAVIVWDMISKPSWGDWQEIVIMLAVVALALFWAIRKAGMPGK